MESERLGDTDPRQMERDESVYDDPRINRFKGLVKMLREVHETYTEIEEIEILEDWVEKSDELSNAALQRAIGKSGSTILKKALSWSESVNAKINELSFEDKKPFVGSKRGAGICT